MRCDPISFSSTIHEATSDLSGTRVPHVHVSIHIYIHVTVYVYNHMLYICHTYIRCIYIHKCIASHVHKCTCTVVAILGSARELGSLGV